MRQTAKKMVFLMTVCVWLSGCMPFQPTQAPCDQYASGCGQKIKINQW